MAFSNESLHRRRRDKHLICPLGTKKPTAAAGASLRLSPVRDYRPTRDPRIHKTQATTDLVLQMKRQPPRTYRSRPGRPGALGVPAKRSTGKTHLLIPVRGCRIWLDALWYLGRGLGDRDEIDVIGPTLYFDGCWIQAFVSHNLDPRVENELKARCACFDTALLEWLRGCTVGS